MDLNHLLYHHQLSLMESASGDVASQGNASRLASHYQRRIDRMRHQMGALPYPRWYRAGLPAGLGL